MFFFSVTGKRSCCMQARRKCCSSIWNQKMERCCNVVLGYLCGHGKANVVVFLSRIQFLFFSGRYIACGLFLTHINISHLFFPFLIHHKQSVLSVVTLWTSHRLNIKRIRLLPMIMDYRLPLEIVVTSSILIVSNVGLRLEVCVLSVTKNGTSRRLNVFLATVNLQVEETKTKNINLLYFIEKKWRLMGSKLGRQKTKTKKKWYLIYQYFVTYM